MSSMHGRLRRAPALIDRIEVQAAAFGMVEEGAQAYRRRVGAMFEAIATGPIGDPTDQRQDLDICP